MLPTTPCNKVQRETSVLGLKLYVVIAIVAIVVIAVSLLIFLRLRYKRKSRKRQVLEKRGSGLIPLVSKEIVGNQRRGSCGRD
ncbi:hypothetical protein CK203_088618 [Vitis vinifera]|uniref:Uncharacterized protein n=1 Tax=Vitis vinifera TaxID=29760 RepID=A0A438C0X3_VITVI|nr:hypothetical protein CK203_088618 [Vitis vinifera]